MAPIAVDHMTEARQPPPDTHGLSADDATDQQRQYLTYLLQRALKQVPFVKLDSVESCVALLTEAVEMLEANIDETVPGIENIDAVISPPPVGLQELRFRSSREVSAENEVRPYDTSDQLTPHMDSTNNEDSTPLGVPAKSVSAAAEDKDASRYVANKLLGVAVTRDYSSPRSAARSLGNKDSGASAAAAAKGKPSMIGLGGNKGVTAPNTAAPSFGEQRSQSSGSRPSSRAQGATQVANTLQQQFTHKPSSRATHATVIPTDTDSDSGSTTDYETGETEFDEIRGVARPLPNKLLNRVGGASKEFPSPKLGPRSIGSGNRASGGALPSSTAPSQVNAQGRSASVPQGRLGLGGGADDPQQSNMHSRTHSVSYDTNEEPVVESVSPIDYTDKDADDMHDENDLTVAHMSMADDSHFDFTQLVKKDPVSQLKQQVPIPVTASPKQFRSSLALLDLAKKSADEQPDIGDQQMLATRPLQNQQLSRLTDSAVNNAPGSPGVGPNGTPKPAWLRRLDSPLTHHGKLMQAKSQMHQLLKRAMVAATRVRSDKIEDAQSVITKALDKLEQSTTIAAAAASNLPQIPNM